MVPFDMVGSPKMTYPALGLFPKVGLQSSPSEATQVEASAGVCWNFVVLRPFSYGTTLSSTPGVLRISAEGFSEP